MNRLNQYAEKLEGEYNIRHKVSPFEEKHAPHIHAQFEVMLVQSPGMAAIINDKRFELAPGTLLLLNDMDLHHIRMERPCGLYDRYVLYFRPEFVRSLSTPQTDLLECFLYRPFEDAPRIALTAEENRSLCEKMDALEVLDAAEENGYGHDLRVKLLLAGLLLDINRLYRERHAISGSSADRYGPVYEVIRYMHTHYREPLTLDDLAHRVYLSKYSLCALFREATGTSPNHYLIQCRIQKAKELLVNGHPVETVCDLTGYRNLSHFSRSFKQAVGQSPKQFQQGGMRHKV